MADASRVFHENTATPHDDFQKMLWILEYAREVFNPKLSEVTVINCRGAIFPNTVCKRANCIEFEDVIPVHAILVRLFRTFNVGLSIYMEVFT